LLHLVGDLFELYDDARTYKPKTNLVLCNPHVRTVLEVELELEHVVCNQRRYSLSLPHVICLFRS